MMMRLLASAPVGIAVTASLLYAMHVLIDMESGHAMGTRDRATLTFVMEKPIEDLNTKQEIIDEISPPLPVPTHTPPTTISNNGSTIYIPRTTPTVPGRGANKISFDRNDGALVSMVKGQPNYPMRAITQDLEGFVVVMYDVNEMGVVENVVVIQSSHKIFEKPSIDAAKRFRYKPRVVNGEPLVTRGLRNKFTFEMEK